MPGRVLELVKCPNPACIQSAEVIDRVKVGGMETLSTVCLSGHRFCGVEA